MNNMTVSDFASLGGKARAAKLSPERRREIAVKAGNTNLEKYGKEYFSKIRQGLKVKDF
jgi:hypothetical protein